RNYAEIEHRLEDEVKRLERSAANERSGQGRTTLDQNIQILREWVTKVRQLDELGRLIDARSRVVSGTAQLIQVEGSRIHVIHGVSVVVDELLVKLEMNEELRSYYDDVIAEGSSALAGLDSPQSISRSGQRLTDY